MSVSNTRLPQPTEWQVFEKQMRELFAAVLGDPNTQMHGRSGQPQNGVDVYGCRGQVAKCQVGIQCKHKFREKITEGELKTELEKAKKFKPAIREFFLVTTADRDAKIQETARMLTVGLAETARPIIVAVWGWQDIEEHAQAHAEVWKAFDPTFNPFAERSHAELIVQLQAQSKQLESIEAAIRTSQAPASNLEAQKSDQTTARHGKITVLQALINDGNAAAALRQLEELKDGEWSEATETERYRLLVATASASLKLGDAQRSGKLLLDAYKECPEHPKATINRAKGYLFTGAAQEAEKCARDILSVNSGSAEAANVLIQALIDDATVSDPISEISEDIRKDPEVLLAYIQFLRCRNDLTWVDLARTAAKENPDNDFLNLMGAEATLQRVVDSDYDAAIVGGPLTTVSGEEFQTAVDALYESAIDAIEKGYALLASTANNAGFALRLADDLDRAKEVLDAGIEQHPDDSGLKLQRALVAYAENDLSRALDILPDQPTEVQMAGLKAEALVHTDRPDDAIKLLDSVDEDLLDDTTRIGYLATRARAYAKLGDTDRAIRIANEQANSHPDDLKLGALCAKILRRYGAEEEAAEAFERVLAKVDDQTPLSVRYELAAEALRQYRDEDAVELLTGRVATDRESEALSTLLAAMINGNFVVAARELLDSLSPELKAKDWYLHAEAILALNTGDPSLDRRLGDYLKVCPNDLEMILARVGVWQVAGQEENIRRLLEALELDDLSGSPQQHIRFAALLAHYGQADEGLLHGYSTLMNHWESDEAHLNYHGLLFLSEGISDAVPEVDVISEDCVVGLTPQSGEKRRYRIEGAKYSAFSEERLAPIHDLAKLLLGKKVGDEITLQEGPGAQTLRIDWIKHVYIDAFHRSLDEFNERFPGSRDLLKVTIDRDDEDPVSDVREITKARAETSLKALDKYESQGLPLAFVASMIGMNPVEAWSSLRGVDRDFRVCIGSAPERNKVLELLKARKREGCIVDAITLSVVRRLGVEKAVEAICGPIHTTQSTIDLLARLSAETEHMKSKKTGTIAWRDGKLAYEEHTEEMLAGIADDRKAELDWAVKNLKVVPAKPKADLAADTRKVVNLFNRYVTDPAIAAQGSDLLLLSDDMGFRTWAQQALDVRSAWTQPVLMVAVDEGAMTEDEYREAICLLALSGHTYTSLDSACLLYQARKDGFEVSSELRRLIEAIGGPTSDLESNTNVAAGFLDDCWAHGVDSLKVLRLASELFASMTSGRSRYQRAIVQHIVEKVRERRGLMFQYCLDWLIGHSIGLPYFNELLSIRNGTATDTPNS